MSPRVSKTVANIATQICANKFDEGHLHFCIGDIGAGVMGGIDSYAWCRP